MKLRTERDLKEENLMKFYNSLLAVTTFAIVGASGMDRIVDAAGAPPPSMGFFVTSAKSKTGNLGGLRARIGFAKLWRPPWARG